MVEVTFLNPYPVSTGNWAYGFHLPGGRNLYQRISISSTGSWRHDYRLGFGTSTASLRSEVSSDIDRSASGRNHLRLVITEGEGWFYINGKLQDKLDLSVTEFDEARLFITQERAGAVTSFVDCSVWEWGPSMAKLPGQNTPTPEPSPTPYVPDVPFYGPVSGVITHEIQTPDNFFELFRGPVTGEDVMVEVTFHNPYDTSEGEWNYGFMLRLLESNTYHWLYAGSNGEWRHEVRFGDDEYTLGFGSSRVPYLDLTPGGKNRLRVVIIGDHAWVFVNGKFTHESDLSAIQGVAPIRLVVDDVLEGVPRFEGFTVWKWHPSLQELPKADEN